MSKSLYDHNERYTQKALDLSNEAGDLMKKLIVRYHNEGFTVREIVGILHSAAAEQECIAILDLIVPFKPEGN